MARAAPVGAGRKNQAVQVKQSQTNSVHYLCLIDAFRNGRIVTHFHVALFIVVSFTVGLEYCALELLTLHRWT